MRTLAAGLLSTLFAVSTAYADTASSHLDQMAMEKIKPGLLTMKTTADGLRLDNAVQTLAATVTENGVSFESTGKSAGKGGFSMYFAGMGRDAGLQPVLSSRLYRSGDIAYHSYTDGITEQFSNSSGGIQQDFIVAEKPAGQGALRLQLQISGATASANGDGAIIALQSGRKLTYDRLEVSDSTGQKLPAHIEVGENNAVAIVVDDSAASYPLAIDPTYSDANWGSMGALNGTDGAINAVAVSGSNVYVAGSFANAGSVAAVNIAKWDGTSWSALGSASFDAIITALAVDSSGNVYAAGDFTTTGSTAANYIAKWNGTSWSALAGGVDNYVQALAVDSSGNLYVGGQFLNVGCTGTGASISCTTAANYVAKWNGSAWSTLGSGAGGVVYSLAADSSGNLYMGGFFSTVNGSTTTANNIAKWNGTTWSSLGTGTANNGVNSYVYAIAISGTNIYVGGQFNKFGTTGSTVNFVAKWNGTTWSSLKPGASTDGVNANVKALALDTSGNLYLGGSFTATQSGTASKYFVKWLTGTSVWSTLGIGVNSTVYAAASDGSGGVYGRIYYLSAFIPWNKRNVSLHEIWVELVER